MTLVCIHQKKRQQQEEKVDGSTEVFVLFFDPLFWQPFINLSVWLFKGRFINAQKKRKFFAGSGFEKSRILRKFSRQKSYFRYFFSGWKNCGVDWYWLCWSGEYVNSKVFKPIMPTRSINNCSSSSTTLLLKPQLESEEELCENWRAAGCLSNLGKILNHGNYVTNFHLSWVFFVVDEEFQTPEKPTTLVGDSNWSSCLLRYAISDIFKLS